ncbi:PilN domain-containing protein [Enterobacteriaceae bacterium ESL0689]|nr:PilN domain-containing protein [Enterobacteriaceae bacterium ESL0689]
MIQMINFLPWREMQRRQKRRIGVGYITGLLLTLATLFQVNLVMRHLDETLAGVRKTQEEQLYSQLRQREIALREQQQQSQQRRLQQQRSALTAAWHPRLRMIATLIPEQAWLTRLAYRQGTLIMTGKTLNLQELAQLEHGLNKVTGFQPAQAGEIHRNPQGIWMFSFTLTGESTRASVF